MAIYGYLRVSSEKQAESGAGIDAQRQDVKNFTGTHGLGDLVGCFEDRAYGRESSPWDRPGLSALLSAVQRGDTVVVAKWDRIGGVVEIAMLERELTRRGVKLCSVAGACDDSPEGRFMRDILASVSGFELRMIRSRTKAALKAKREKGEAYCRRKYGFRSVEGRFIADAEEQAILKEIAETVARGVSLNAVAQDLNQRGIRSPNGGRWAHSTVKRVAERFRAAQAWAFNPSVK